MMPDTAAGMQNEQSVYKSGISPVGWIIAAAAVALLYQWKPARPIVAGIVLLVLLGMLLRSTNTITNQFSKIFRG